jgi:hypothetical protein
MPPSQHKPFWLEHDNFFLVPVCHYKMEFAREVRRSFLAVQPQRVAVELPQFLAAPLEQAVRRLPKLSTLVYQTDPITYELNSIPEPILEQLILELIVHPDTESPTEDPFELLARLLSGAYTSENPALSPDRLKEQLLEGAIAQGAGVRDTMLLPVESTDAFVEATRSALEAGLPWHCIDMASQNYGQHLDYVPDSTSLTATGLGAFWGVWRHLSHPDPDPIDQMREAHMAQNLQMLRRLYPEDKILVVLGLTHVEPVLRYLQSGEAPLAAAPDFTPDVQVVQPDLNSVRTYSLEMPYVITLYELQRNGPGPDEDAWRGPATPPEAPPEDPRKSLSGVEPGQLVASLESMLGLRRRPTTQLPPKQKRALARYLRGLTEEPAALFQLLSQIGANKAPDQLHLPEVAPPPQMRAFTFRQVVDRRGQLLGLYEKALQDAGGEVLDRQRMLQTLVATASDFYTENTGDHLAPWQVQVLYQFSRNYARLKGRLLPDTYELTMSARGVADDNYSYELWDLATFHAWAPGEDEASDVPVMHMDPETFTINGEQMKRWRFHRKMPRRRLPGLVRQRDKEKDPGEWADPFEEGTLCSYPPEDLVIEDYARYLQKRAIQQLSLEKSRVEPFTTSLLDGIDMRETLRNWHEKTLYVRESRRVHGGVGAVILIFDEDDSNDRYPWRMTWHGEHSQESDMAFYATPVTHKIVGPGIARCEYGGLLMTYPNRRLADVWNDPMYADCRSKAEVLTMAALDYGEDRHVVYVAAKPPRSHFRSLASRLGKKIVYLPIGSLSPQSIQRIRVFHVLSGHQVRKVAKDYIW